MKNYSGFPPWNNGWKTLPCPSVFSARRPIWNQGYSRSQTSRIASYLPVSSLSSLCVVHDTTTAIKEHSLANWQRWPFTIDVATLGNAWPGPERNIQKELSTAVLRKRENSITVLLHRLFQQVSSNSIPHYVHSFSQQRKQERKYTYKAAFRRVRKTIVAVAKH